MSGIEEPTTNRNPCQPATEAEVAAAEANYWDEVDYKVLSRTQAFVPSSTFVVTMAPHSENRKRLVGGTAATLLLPLQFQLLGWRGGGLPLLNFFLESFALEQVRACPTIRRIIALVFPLQPGHGEPRCRSSPKTLAIMSSCPRTKKSFTA